MKARDAALLLLLCCSCLTGCNQRDGQLRPNQPRSPATTQPQPKAAKAGAIHEIDIIGENGRFIILPAESSQWLKTMPMFPAVALAMAPTPPAASADEMTAPAKDPADDEEEDEDDEEEAAPPAMAANDAPSAGESADKSAANMARNSANAADSAAGAGESTATSQPGLEDSSKPIDELPAELAKLGFPPRPPVNEGADVRPGEVVFVILSNDAAEKARVRQIIMRHGYPCITVSLAMLEDADESADEPATPQTEPDDNP